MELWAIFLILGLVGLLCISRNIEGFSAGQPGIRCGVNLPKCPPGKWCMNGICMRPDAPRLPKNQLPVYP